MTPERLPDRCAFLFFPGAGAIQTLLISDSLFRINDVAKRKKYVSLVDSVKESGGEVCQS